MKNFELTMWLAVATSIFVSSSSQARSSQALHVSIDQQSGVDDSLSGIINVHIQNVSDDPLFLPKFRTPLITPDSRLMSNVFEVVDHLGNRARYKGRHVRTSPSKPEKFYQRIEAGEALSHRVDLTADYELASGVVYSVHYLQAFTREILVDEAGEVASDEEQIESNTLTVEVASDPLLQHNASGEPDPGRKCAKDELAAIYLARREAPAWTQKAIDRIRDLYEVEVGKNEYGDATYSGRIRQDDKYEHWFGKAINDGQPYASRPSYTDYWRQHNDFVMMKSLNSVYLRIGGERYVCGCSSAYETTAAWTETANANLIHVCDFFFHLPVSSGIYDSQLLTLIHEYSHFEDSHESKTEDYAYGRNAAHRLTTSDRSRAVRNADNVMYFVGATNQ